MEVRLPNLGEDADSGTVASIFVKEGDTVEKDQPLIEIESEKAVASVPSTAAGKVTRIHVSEGDEIRVGAPIVTIDGDPSEAGGGREEPEAASGSADDDADGTEERASPGGAHADSGSGEDTGGTESAAGGERGEVRLPNLGEGVESATVTSIFVKAGDRIEKDQSLIEIESEKAVASVPSTAAGTVAEIHVKEGEEVSVGGLIVTLSDSGGSGSKTSSEPTRPSKDADRSRSASGKEPRGTLPEGSQPAASPSIRKMARDLGIDLSRVRPTARGGRILLDDVRRYILDLQKGVSSRPAPEAARPGPSVDFSRWGPIEVEKASSLRKTIASRMADSWATIPHVMQFGDADITALNTLRKKYASAYQERDVKLTLTPILLKALAGTLEKHALINSSWDESSGSIVRKEYVHIGVAVDTEAGLLVPVIRDANKKSVLELALEVESLSRNARERKLGKEQMQGGSFTISNQGGIGGTHFTPIINKPEAAILGVGRGREVVRMKDQKPEGRMLLPLTLSHDHRIIDGADGVRFLIDLIEAFETFPESALELNDSKG